jgi:hypothetical protein
MPVDAAPAPQVSRALAVVLAAAFLAATGSFLLAALTFDVLTAGRHGVHELLVVAVCVVLALPAAAVAGLARRRWMTRTLAVAAAATCALLLTPWHPRKRFARDLSRVTTGMTVDDVERVLGGYMLGAGRKWVVPPGPAPVVDGPEERADVAAVQAAWVPPKFPVGEERARATGVLTFRWSDDASYDADWGVVSLREGRVVAVRFMPD